MQAELMTDAVRNDDAQHLEKRILLIAAFNGLAAIGVIVGFLFWMVSAVDTLARNNSHAIIESALQAELDSVALSTADYAYWTSAYEWITNGEEEPLLDNFGSGATDSDTFDFIYLFDHSAEPLFAYETEGTGSDLSIFDAALANRLLPEVLSEPFETYHLVSSFESYGEEIAVIAATRVTPDDTEGLTETDLPVMIAGRWLSEDKLLEIGNKLLLTDLAIGREPERIAEQSVAFGLMAANGTPIAHLSWTPPLPGKALLTAALPVVLLLAALTLIATLVIGRTSARQTTAYLRQRQIARTDGLTGLPNRAGLEQLLKSAPISRALESGHIAVAYLDLNNFKHLNDSEGHDAGDLALQIFAERVRGALRTKDSIVRLGGDEFACILIDESPGQTADHVARRIITRTAPPVRIGDTAHAIAPSIGIAIGAPGVTWEQLIKRADTAMYQAKASGTHDPVFYSDTMAGQAPFQRAMAS